MTLSSTNEPTEAAMRAAERLYADSIISGCTPEIVAQYIDEATGLPELIEMRKQIIAVEDAINGKETAASYISQQGQGMDGYSALANFQSIARKAKASDAEKTD